MSLERRSRSPFKNPFVAPAVAALLLMGAVGYYFLLSHESRELMGEIRSLQRSIQEKRGVLRSLEELDMVRGSPMVAALARWVPSFEDPLEARLRCESRLLELLKVMGAADIHVKWEETISTDRVREGRLSAKALLPSFGSLLNWLEELEEGAPPMIPRSLEVRKEATRLRVSLWVSLFFRLEHGAL
ncbi:MAG: hypothetical protein ACUVS3_12065 [Thermodesulfobacteriota bacterium]